LSALHSAIFIVSGLTVIAEWLGIDADEFWRLIPVKKVLTTGSGKFREIQPSSGKCFSWTRRWGLVAG
jgi:hypothetical protein